MQIDTSRRVLIQEVAPRDGFQIEPRWIDTDRKVAFIDAVSDTGMQKIEVSAFVSPKAVPSLRDAAEVFGRIRRRPGMVYGALVPNLRGAEHAIAAGADEINLVISVSETHNRANIGMPTAKSLGAVGAIVAAARQKAVRTNVSFATSFGCPFEGGQPLDRVLGFVEQCLAAGADSISLADTTGMADPRQVSQTVEAFVARFAAVPLTLHFHNTRGMGLANILAAYASGATRFDAALGGLGGCPFAPGASGNVCTEDVVHMFGQMGVETGIDLAALLAVARTVPDMVGHDVPGQLIKAGRTCDLHAAPALA
jgi:hydroxymethylglutaryl-CoA lyase